MACLSLKIAGFHKDPVIIRIRRKEGKEAAVAAAAAAAAAVTGCEKHSQLWSEATCYMTQHTLLQLCVFVVIVSSGLLVQAGCKTAEWWQQHLCQG